MAKIRFPLELTPKQKEKLFADARLYGFSSATAYLCELIERGLPASGSLDLKLQLIEQKIDTLSANTIANDEKSCSLLKEMLKRIFVNLKVSSYVLGHTFFIKPGKMSQQNRNEANAYIHEQIEKAEKRFEEN